MRDAMRVRLIPEPLSTERFAPYGDVLVAPSDFGRVFFDSALQNLRPGARPSLSITHTAAQEQWPLEITRMERHEFSSQSFVPLAVSRWLILVTASDADGGPDALQLRAFVAGPRHGVTYHAGTWHYPLNPLDGAAQFAVLMWCDGTSADEEFRALSEPVVVERPSQRRPSQET